MEQQNEIQQPTLDTERQVQAKIYARIRRRLMFVDLFLGIAYLLAWLLFGWSLELRELLSAFINNDWLLVAVYSVIFGGIYYLISAPLSYYQGYILPHRFNLSTQTLRAWIIDQIKGGLVAGVLGLFVLEVMYAILRNFADIWWLWVAGFLLVFNVLLANLAPVLLFPIFYKFKPLGEEYADLEARLMKLAKEAGTGVRGVFEFDMSRRTKAANAAFTGLGNTRRILLGDTLLKEFTPEEIETILAHELAHHVHKDIPVGIVVETVVTLFGLYLASLFLAWGVTAMGLEGVGDIAGLPLVIIAFGAYGLITMPLTNAFSRWRERRADQYALKLTGNGSAYASALTRMANQNLADVDPAAWEEFLFHSHPSLSKRIAMAHTNQ